MSNDLYIFFPVAEHLWQKADPDKWLEHLFCATEAVLAFGRLESNEMC